MMKKFRTVEDSRTHPYGECGLHFLTVKSPALQSRADVCVYECDAVQQQTSAPMVILLHGVYGSCWSWALSGGASQVLDTMLANGSIPPMLLVMPSDGLWGDGSGYLNHGAKNYEQWIVEDVIELIRHSYDCIDEHSPIFIAGLSMGGYGALRLGAKFPTIFTSFYGLSSITDFNQLQLFVEEPINSFGSIDRKDASVIQWIKSNQSTIPFFGFNCGLQDELLEFNRTLHHELLNINIPHDYYEYDGGHTWDYWHKHLIDAFTLFAKHV